MTAQIVSPMMVSVLELLARQRSAATYAGGMLPTLLDRLALLEQDMLIELRLPGSASAYLLFQRGWIVYARWQQMLGLAALEPITALAPLAALRAIPLASAAATLAFAAVGGGAVDASLLGDVPSDSVPGDSIPGDSIPSTGAPTERDLEAQLARLRTWQFSGVLTHSPAHSSAQTGTTTDEHDPQSRADHQVVSVWYLVQGRVAAQVELSHDGPFAPLLLAWDDHPLPRLNTPAALPPPLPDLPNLPPPPDLPLRNSALSRPAGSGLPGDAEIWKLFQSVTQAQLGAAAPRLIRLMLGKHGEEHGPQLQESLGRQIDRIANKALGQQFRTQLSTPIPAAPSSGTPSSAAPIPGLGAAQERL